MAKIKIELTIELLEAIEANRGTLSRDEFIAAGMAWAMNRPKKLKLNKEGLLK